MTAVAVALISILPAGADVTGLVTLTGKPMSKDETFVAQSFGCGESPVRHTENWKVGPKGELGDVVVWIVDPRLPTPAPVAPEVAIKQIGCRYEPHVLAVTAGVPFKIINGDPTLHNVRARMSEGPAKPPGADVFNFGQTYQGQTDERQFDDAGLYMLRCDVHSWMQAWVMALPQSCFAVTGPDGKFDLTLSGQLADGAYTIKAWHPRFAQPVEQTVQVKKGVAVINFAFEGARSF
jgi:plastocyanin